MSALAAEPLASLPMYDHPAIRRETDQFWAALSSALNERGVTTPEVLTRQDPYSSFWSEPGLLFSQTCGYPYLTMLQGQVRLVGTPCYSVEGFKGAHYCSALVVRAEDDAQKLADLQGRVAAYNAPQSQSGYNTLRVCVAPLAQGGRFFSGTVETGSHGASLDAVAEGRADVCASDCVTFGLIARYEPERAACFRVIGWTGSVPGLPFVTSAQTDEKTVGLIQQALRTVFAAPALAGTREALMLTGVEFLTDEDYRCILEMEQTARDLGYPELK